MKLILQRCYFMLQFYKQYLLNEIWTTIVTENWNILSKLKIALLIFKKGAALVEVLNFKTQ